MSPENVVSDTDSANTDPGNEVTSTFIYDETDPDIVSRIEQCASLHVSKRQAKRQLAF